MINILFEISLVLSLSFPITTMVARNLKLEYITDDSKRKATFGKRKQG